MVAIEKKHEPAELLQYRLKPYATYTDMPADVKSKVKENLLNEQGHLCAYCMRKIDSGTGKQRCTIEHCLPQAVSSEADRLNYRNMVAVCWGNRDASDNMDKHCDASRGALKSEHQKMKKIDIFQESTLLGINYKSDGTIFSEDKDTNEDLNLRLNLNCETQQLKECRLSALNKLRKTINDKYPQKTVPKDYLMRLLEYYSTHKEKMEPYCGILIYWLKHHT